MRIGSIKSVLMVLMYCIAFAASAEELIGPVAPSIENITEYRLANGLHVIMAPNASAQVMAVDLVYRIGSRADPVGAGGTAHLLEHLMFKGSIGNSTLTDALTQRGIRFNATTSYDRTCYQSVFAADAATLDWLLALQADRMAHLQFDQTDLDHEIPVVLREMELAQSNPVAALTQGLLSIQDMHGYGHHPLGARGDVERLKLADLRAFHRAHYGPNQAVLVLSGKFDSANVLRQIQRVFGQIATQAMPVALATPEHPSSAARAVTLHANGALSMAALAYPIPPARDPVLAELSVLAHVLAGNPSGRLYQALVVPHKAVGVDAKPLALQDTGLFIFSATVSDTHAVSAAQRALLAELKRFQHQPITAQELSRAKDVFRSLHAQIAANPVLLANVLAEQVAIGDWRLLFQQFNRIDHLRKTEVQHAAARYLLPTTVRRGALMATTSTSLPQQGHTAVAPSQPQVATPLQTTVEDQDSVTEAGTLLPKVHSPGLAILDAKTTRFTLPNGLRVALLSKSTPGNRVRGALNLRFGDDANLFGKQAVAALTALLLTSGTRTHPQQQLIDRVNQLGGQIQVIPDDDHVSVRFETPRSALPAMLTLITELVREPAFPKNIFDSVRQQQIVELQQRLTQPAVVADDVLSQRSSPYPFGDRRHPLDTQATIAALKTVTRQDVKHFHAHFFGADHGELAMVGAFDRGQVRTQLDALLGNWTSRAHYQRPQYRLHVSETKRFHIATPGSTYGAYVAWLPLPVRADRRDAAALTLVNHVIGAMPIGARLTERLRNQEGLSYQARTQIHFSSFDPHGSMTIAATYPLNHGEQVHAIVQETLAQLVKDGITTQELAQAQAAVLQSSRLNRGDEGALLNQLLLLIRTNRSFQSLAQRDALMASFTVAQVNAVIRTYFAHPTLIAVLADASAQSTP